MSFERLPDRMAGYTTYELAQLLGKLSGPQRAAIDRIVQHVFIDNRPWAELFRGEHRICAEPSYYRRGRLDPATGEYARGHKPGWGHDADFQAALQEAVKLALGAQERERLHWLQRAKRRAEERAEHAVNTWVAVMDGSMDDKARNDAAGRVIDLAFKGSGDTANTSAREEADWWAAAGGEDD